MIWRLTYCNKKGAEARVDIIKGDRTPVEVVQGSANPFTRSYKLDKNDKSGHIMTSSADIEIFETETFNIDDLKTSNETELKVEYFEGNVLTWSGFILPDFFSREIGSPNIIRMTASDRLSALKGVTLSDLPTKVSLRDLIELSLEQTGLDLALVAQIQINQGSTNILDSEILSQRLTDTRGRSISCYDILMSIMVATNSTIRQREGQWVVYNKLEHELRTPTIFFDKVERGAIRTIQPVASSVGVYKEFGGSKTYPENYNFKSGGVGWAVNFPEEMSASFSSNNILGFDVLTSGGGYQPVYGNETNNPHAVIYGFRGPLNYLKSEDIPVPSGYTNEVDIKLDINASAPIWNFGSHQRVSVFAVKGERTQVLTSNGFVDISTSSESEYIHTLQFEAGVVLAGELARVDTNSLALSGKLSDSEGLDGYSVHIRLYSSDRAYATVINFASINFAPTGDSPKGDLYKTTQGSNFTKQHDVETTIFGDYITSGLNGYFYKYPIDDTSNLFLPNGTLSSPAWITLFDTTKRPLLHHISRQKSRLFSVAHDILKANINVDSFDPLAVFQDCKGGKYVIVSASFDFLRSEVDVELEQIAYDKTILKRDFIYSYFGEGESNIKSIGGIAGGGGGTGGTGGGGMTPEQLEMLTNLASWWKLDEENDAIYSEKNVYSLKGVSALGLGDGSGGGDGGGGIDRLDSWANYTPEKADYYVPASLLVPFRSNTLSRLESLEAGGGATDIEVEVTGSGNAVTGVSKSGNTLTFAKSSTFALSTQVHSHSNKPILDQITQSNIDVLSKLSIVDGNIKVDTTLWATGGISALGLGDGGGSGGSGVDMLDSWANYTTAKANYYVPASLLVPFRSDTLSRLTSLENGSATSIDTTGSGNAITSVSKSGNTLTFTKGSTFSLSTHTHTIAQITGLQGALDSKATQSDIDTAVNELEIGGRNLISTNFLNYNTEGTYGYIQLVEEDTNLILKVYDKDTSVDMGGIYFGFTRDGSGSSGGVSWAMAKGSLSKDLIKVTDFHYFSYYPKNEATFNKIFERFNIKIEKGTKATDWTPAPEDQVSDWNTTDVTSFSYIKNKPTQLSQFTDNIGISSHIANKSNPHNVTTSQIGAVDLTTNQTITGAKTFNANITLGVNRNIQGTDNYTGVWNVDNLLWRFGSSRTGSVANIRSEKVGIGTDNPLYKLDVSGDGRFTGNLTASTGVNTPKVIFAAAGWSLEQVGTELQIKHNGVIKQRMLSNGTILATGGITALST